MDLFASRNKAKAKKFCPWKRYLEAWIIDVFTINWKNWNFYAFPPFSVILRCLRKILNGKACAILVIPYWSSQPWCPTFIAILMDKPIIFSPSPSLLSSPCRWINHPLARHFSSIAGKLSGQHTERKMCLKIPLTSWFHPWQNQPFVSMNVAWKTVVTPARNLRLILPYQVLKLFYSIYLIVLRMEPRTVR